MHKADWVVLCALTLPLEDAIEFMAEQVREDVLTVQHPSFHWWAKRYARDVREFTKTERWHTHCQVKGLRP